MSARVIGRGTWFRGLYGTDDRAISPQFPSSKRSSIPTHNSRVDPFRPECPICAPIGHAPCW